MVPLPVEVVGELGAETGQRNQNERQNSGQGHDPWLPVEHVNLPEAAAYRTTRFFRLVPVATSPVRGNVNEWR